MRGLFVCAKRGGEGSRQALIMEVAEAKIAGKF